MAEVQRGQTRVLDARGRATALLRAKVRLVVENGIDAGRSFDFESALIRLGSVPGNDVVLRDEFVSGVHAEIELSEQGFVLRDLESTNGTWLGGFRIREGFLKAGARLKVGETSLRFEPTGTYEVPLAAPGVHGIVGESLAVREAVALLERYAGSDSPVLLQGETGVGKDLFARALHQLSARREGPFEVFDCGAASATLIEAQIFGHAKGAFTDAAEARAGVFERASGGTLLIDEVGELPLELQPKLLRILEEGKVRRLGDTKTLTVDVRVAAATHRDLQAMVAQGKFRADLFYRLNVLRLEIPPLRRRAEDIPLLAAGILGPGAKPLEPAAVEMLSSYPWPGNVRELRNVLSRAQALSGERIGPGDLMLGAGRGAAPAAAPARSYHAAKEACLEAFEREYLERLLAAHQGNVTRAAEAAEVPRQTLHRLMAKHGMKGGGGGTDPSIPRAS